MVLEERRFYRHWIVANGLAEGGGLGTTFVLAQAVAPSLEQIKGLTAILGSALVAVALGTLLEGVFVGFAQERVLRSRLIHLRPRTWTIATAIGAGAAWALGMVPSTIMSMTAGQTSNIGVSEPGLLAQYGLAVLLGLVTGPVLGIAQWAVLRSTVNHAANWLWANALAWGFGMPVIFLGMECVPWNSHPAVKVVAIYAVCAAAGVAVGATHGLVLVRLLRSGEHAAT